MNSSELEFLYACRVIRAMLIQIGTARLAEMLSRIKHTVKDLPKEKLIEFEEMMPDALQLVRQQKTELIYNDEEIKVKITIEWEDV